MGKKLNLFMLFTLLLGPVVAMAAQMFMLDANGNIATPATQTFYNITPEIQIKAQIITEERGPIDAIFKLGGTGNTQRGDQVMWGYFYASPQDVTWGSEQNPDLFVKIWFDAAGRIDINYFHVSVPNIAVTTKKTSITDSSAKFSERSTTISMRMRYIRHYVTPDGDLSLAADRINELSQANHYNLSYQALTQPKALAKAIIHTVELGAIEAEEYIGGEAKTDRGDFVMWGYFYADPNKVSWGNRNNPDIFYKIWQDGPTQRYDVNFFHVSVPEISASSAIVYSDGNKAVVDLDTSKQSLATTTDRYIRHEYHLKN